MGLSHGLLSRGGNSEMNFSPMSGELWMTTFALIENGEQQQRYEAKLKRELGKLVLAHLADPRTEDILLNPDSVLWIKRLGEGFQPIGEMPPLQAASALHTVAAWRGTNLNHDQP